MREDLLGYLLSALEPHEMRRVERKLRDDPALREELEFLQQTLAPLDRALADLPVVETPPDLVARTMANLPALAPPLPCATGASGTAVGVKMAPAKDPRRPYRASWSDIVFGGLAAAALFAILIPSIARGRHEARTVACQDHLRQLGTAITQYAMLNRRELLPQIAERGPEAFAGVYGVRLNDSGLLPDSNVRYCPESDLPPLPPGSLEATPLSPASSYNADSTLMPLLARIISSEELQLASENGDIDQLRWAQQTAGGNYAYNLGVVDEEQYEAPQYEGRATFAVLGDSPIAGTETASEVDVSRLRWGHRDSGANLLFEDGSVRFVDMARAAQFPDHPYFNHRGSIEAGVNVDDASLAPSWRAPFISVRQR
ncbi:MAG: hypothetical protein ACO1RT_07940 [Planctomycetaceae bacterium]